MEETLFSKIIRRAIPAEIIYEDEDTISFLDIAPFEKGHVLVVPKKPYTTIFDMEEKEFLQLMKIVKKVATNLRNKLNCDVNIWQNNGEISGQEVPHVHFHIVPRKQRKKTYCLENRDSYEEEEIKKFTSLLKMN